MAIPAFRIASPVVTGSPADRVADVRASVRERGAQAVIVADAEGQALGVIPAAELEGAAGRSPLSSLKQRPLTAVPPETDVGVLIGDLEVEPRDAWFALRETFGYTGIIAPETVRIADDLRQGKRPRAGVFRKEVMFGTKSIGPGELWGDIDVKVPGVIYRCPNGHELTADEAAQHYDDDGNVRCPVEGSVMTRELKA
jgi:hypothetical protein